MTEMQEPTGEEKKCTKCGTVYPKSLDNFPRLIDGKDGLAPACKSCANQRYREWRAQNSEKAKAQDKRAYQRQKAAGKSPQKEWQKRNKARVRENGRRWVEENRERVRQTKRMYESRRRALLYAAKGNHTLEDVLQMYEDQQGLCAYCTIPLEGEYHVDHMVPLVHGGSNSWENLAITCVSCNISKNARTVEAFVVARKEELSHG